ncbi:ABC transporter permease [Desulfobulbus alkaliphilus]|uniref:ABC transporter permease n=1 Tax=Desulfobulbus alkaliphilus TaxID=869814 RepID=UPI0019664E6B|nr:ABC transporter permease [Desulfobulbus alkaliphilus]MBM9537367.1 ABC transporter permease [Desulfobulbus alkaliphilus]
MQDFPVAPKKMLDCLWCNRYLILTFIQREISGRYRGSFMGLVWSFIYPMLMLAVYTFVFSVVFKARWNSGSDSKTEFALILFAGLMLYNLLSECLIRAPNLILSNVNYVKKVIFPLEILPVVIVGVALFHTVVSFFVWIIAYMVLFGQPHITIFLFPLVVVPLLFLTLGLSWGLASLGVYIRDVSQFIGVTTTALLFLSPIFYSISSLPENYQIFINLNPLTPIIEQSRKVLFSGELPDIKILFSCYLLSLPVMWLGFVWFQKTRKGFSDVL